MNLDQAPGLAAHSWEEIEAPGEGPLGVNPATSVSRMLSRANNAGNGSQEAGQPEAPEMSPILRSANLGVLLLVASPDMPPAMDPLPHLELDVERGRLEEALKDQKATLRYLAGVNASGEASERPLHEYFISALEDKSVRPPRRISSITAAMPDRTPIILIRWRSTSSQLMVNFNR